jgi:hypothetical protein
MLEAGLRAILRAMTTQLTSQVAYMAAIALAMIVAGLSKRRLEWKPPRKRKRRGRGA